MKPLYRNLFLLFGVAAIVVMLCTFDVDYEQLRDKLPRVPSTPRLSKSSSTAASTTSISRFAMPTN